MRLIVFFFVAFLCCGTSAIAVDDSDGTTLLGTITKWQYPDSTISDAKMSDAATMDANEKRTAPSLMLKTTVTTEDSVEDVLNFYRALLKRTPKTEDKLGFKSEAGMSVVFSNESEGRPFAFHTISVNTSTTSTTLIITRGGDETETRITWKQYRRLTAGG